MLQQGLRLIFAPPMIWKWNYLRFDLEGLPPRECLTDFPAARLPGLARVAPLALDVRTGKYRTMLDPAAKFAWDFTSFHAATSAVVTW